MPHDAKGNVLHVGDKVAIVGTVTQIFPSDDFCNCSVELDRPMPPNGTKSTFSAINTKQVEKIPVEGEQ